MKALEESSAAAAAEHLEAKLLADHERMRLLQRLEQREKEADEAAERLTNWRSDATFRYTYTHPVRCTRIVHSLS